MKLKTINKQGKEEYIEIDFWSFVKCHFFAGLAVAAFIYAFLAGIGIILGMLNPL